MAGPRMPDDMELLAARAVAALPEPFRAAAEEVAINVSDWPTAEMLDMLGMSRPIELTGLYEGIPLTEKSFMDQPHSELYFWRKRWRTISAAVLTTKVNMNRTSAARNSTR